MPARNKHRRRHAIVGANLVGLVGLVAAAWFLSRVDDSPPARSPDPVVVSPLARDRSVNSTKTSESAPIQLALHSDPSANPTPVDRLAAKMDARRDDWDTEVLSDAAVGQLSVIQDLLERGPPIHLDAIERVVNRQFKCQALRPANLSEVYRDRSMVVHRATSLTRQSTAEFSGPFGFGQALEQIDQVLGNGNERHVKFKLYRISREPESFTTRVRFEASEHHVQTSRQLNAIWECEWSYPGLAGRPAMLLSIQLDRYEQAAVTAPSGKLFADCTQSAIGRTAGYRQQVVAGVNDWLTRIPREFMGQFGHNGLSVGDVNGDGLDDVYVCDSGGLPNQLYVQQPDGTAHNVSSAAGVDFLDDSTGSLLVDLDNDGDQDLVVGADPRIQIAENDGNGRFRLLAGIEVNTDTFSISAADFDNDGDLDLYVCGYNVRQKDPTDRGLPFPLPYHDANNGGRNVLLRNDGNLRFVDATQAAGLDQNNSRFSMAAAWEDFDNDGDQDLYVANDFGRNNLYRNDKGHFTDIAAQAGVQDHASGMSVSWGDYNRDGMMDLYIGNMFSAAGNRITYQSRFAKGRADQTVRYLQRMARGNTLFANFSQETRAEFRDFSEQEAVEMGRWAWASKFADLTNDGWPDLIVANGYVSSTNPDDL